MVVLFHLWGKIGFTPKKIEGWRCSRIFWIGTGIVAKNHLKTLRKEMHLGKLLENPLIHRSPFCVDNVWFASGCRWLTEAFLSLVHTDKHTPKKTAGSLSLALKQNTPKNDHLSTGLIFQAFWVWWFEFAVTLSRGPHRFLPKWKTRFYLLWWKGSHLGRLGEILETTNVNE